MERTLLTLKQVKELEAQGMECYNCRSGYRCAAYYPERYGKLCKEFIKVDCTLCIHRLNANGDHCTRPFSATEINYNCGFQRDKKERPPSIKENSSGDCSKCENCYNCPDKKWVENACQNFKQAECKNCIHYAPSIYQADDGAFVCSLNHPDSWNIYQLGCGFEPK